MFDPPSQDLDKISSLAVRIDEENMFGLEVCYPPETMPVRLGLEGVRTEEISSFPINYANGEHIRGIECFYELEGSFLGFKVYIFPTICHSKGTPNCK